MIVSFFFFLSFFFFFLVIIAPVINFGNYFVIYLIVCQYVRFDISFTFYPYFFFFCILFSSFQLIDDKIFCTHGGLSPDLTTLEKIRRIVRPTEVPEQGLLCDLLWADPSPLVEVCMYVNLLYI
jgi:hypothetical protein